MRKFEKKWKIGSDRRSTTQGQVKEEVMSPPEENRGAFNEPQIWNRSPCMTVSLTQTLMESHFGKKLESVNYTKEVSTEQARQRGQVFGDA
eukprot:5506221-Amphidinium_carterae.1